MRWERKTHIDWRPWFAWRPVILSGTDTIVWLERVERRYGVLVPSASLWSGRWLYREARRTGNVSPAGS